MANIHELIEKRAAVWESVKDGFERTERDGISLDSPEAEERYTRQHAELVELDRRIKELDDLNRRNADAAEMRDRYATAAPSVNVDAIRRMANGEIRSMEFAPEARDLTKGSSTAGGNTVPTSFYGQLWAHLIETSAIRQTRVRQIRTASGENLQVPKTTSHSSAALIGEGNTITESDPAFGQVTLGAFKYGLSIQVATELEQDTGVDLAGYLAMQAGRALANATGTHFVTGDGSSKPLGIVTASTLGVTGGDGVAGAFTSDNLIDLYYSVIAPYRINGEWLMSDGALKAARKLKDSDNQYIWAPGLTAGEPSILLGRPVFNDYNMAAPALDAKSVLFGDFSAYMIRDVAGVRVERSVDFAFQNDLVTWRFLLRTDGDLIDTTGAVKHFVGGSS